MKRLVSIAVLAMTLACSIVKAGNPETKPRDSLEKIGTYCSAISYPHIHGIPQERWKKNYRGLKRNITVSH
jgi:hypothetical protein